MVRFNTGALALTCALALVLAVPAFGIVLQDEAELTEFHNRVLTPWPSIGLLRSEPIAYVQQGRTWLSERIFPVQLATRAQKTVLLRQFNQPPEPRVSLGDDGHIFLNGASNDALYGLFRTACVDAHTESTARSLAGAIQYWSTQSQQRAITTDFIVIPTAATLYADKLPPSTPAHLREACLQRMKGRSELLSVGNKGTSTRFVYPLLEMLAAKDDPGFYPKGNWHPAGKSLHVARSSYLARLGARASAEEKLALASGPAEILLSYGIDLHRPYYTFHNPFITHSAAHDSLVRNAIAPVFRGDRFITHVYRNSQPPLDQAVLMLSDSFGDLAAEVIAGAFRTLIQVNLNALGRARPSNVVDRVRQVLPVDRVIFLIQEGNAPQLAGWR